MEFVNAIERQIFSRFRFSALGLVVGDEALKQLSMSDAAPAAASRASRLSLAGMALPVVSAKHAHINDGGVARDQRLAAPTVGQLLAAAGAPLQQDDKVVPPAWTPVIAGANSLSTDDETATERDARVLVVPITLLEFTFDAERSTRIRPRPRSMSRTRSAATSPHRSPVVASSKTMSGCLDSPANADACVAGVSRATVYRYLAHDAVA